MARNGEWNELSSADAAKRSSAPDDEMCEFGIWSQESLGKPIVYLFRHYSTYLDHMLAPHGISAAHVPLLGYLWDGGGGETQNQIAQELGVDKATVSRVVAYLVKEGLVEQSVSPRDSRAFVVELTDAGRTLCGPVGQVLRGWTDALIGDLDSDDVKQTLGHLQEMIGRARELLITAGVREAAHRIDSPAPIERETETGASEDSAVSAI